MDNKHELMNDEVIGKKMGKEDKKDGEKQGGGGVQLTNWLTCFCSEYFSCVAMVQVLGLVTFL